MDRRTAPTGFPQQVETHMDSLTDFVDQLSAEATSAIPPSIGITTLGDFNDNSTVALKLKDLLVDTIYQVRSATSIHTQHGRTFILSLQTADGFCYNAWTCGMLTKELLQNSSILEDKQQLRWGDTIWTWNLLMEFIISVYIYIYTIATANEYTQR